MSQLTVPWREPLFNANGLPTPAGTIFLNELIARVGGIGNVDDLGEVITLLSVAQAQIDYQAFQPQDAGTQEAMRRIAEVESRIEEPPNLSPINARLDELEAALLDIPGQPAATVLEQWTAPALLNSWVNFGAPYNPAGYWKDPFGVVHLRGILKSGTVGSPSFVLPVGYRPANTEQFITSTNSASGQVEVDNAGNVTLTVGSNVNFDLDGIAFRAQ